MGINVGWINLDAFDDLLWDLMSLVLTQCKRYETHGRAFLKITRKYEKKDNKYERQSPIAIYVFFFILPWNGSSKQHTMK